MKTHLLLIGAVLAFILDGADSKAQVTEATAQGASSGSNRPSNIFDDLKRKYPRDVENRRQYARRAYRDLFDALELSPEDGDRLVDALTESEVLTSSWDIGDELKHEPLAEDWARADAIMADIETMLGPDRFAVLVAYRDTLSHRYKLLPLVDQLYSVGRPLSAEQKEQLVGIMVAEWDRLEAGALNSPLSTLPLEKAQQAVARADNHDLRLQELFGSVLTSGQLEIARSYFAYRAQRRHEALERYQQKLAENPLARFPFPADAS